MGATRGPARSARWITRVRTRSRYAVPVPGYTHVCDACGAEVAVHERYVGRTLRCTTCGTAFLADPTLAEAVRRARGAARDRRRRRIARRWWIAAAAAAGVALLVAAGWWLGRPEFGEGLRPQLFYGQLVEVAGTGERLAAIDHAVVGDLVRAARTDDAGRLAAVAAEPGVIRIAAGTKLQVVEVRKRDRAVVVRVLDGIWTGRKVVIPTAWVE